MLIYKCTCGDLYETEQPTIDRECEDCKRDAKPIVEQELYFIRVCASKKCKNKIYKEKKKSRTKYCDTCAYKRQLKQSHEQNDRDKQNKYKYKYEYTPVVTFNTRNLFKKVKNNALTS